uniref:U3 small nucleolar RNA-associated protein 6 N-terminal domain-containing protein n=1 Tax=Ciona savignyi TaxID=51511 RepID=H2ZPF8_CIOSA
MAELVNQHAEEMLPELEQMQRVGLFSTAEIKAVIKKRSAHEYKLVRKTKVMKDFLAYIQYEVNFLGLIHKRRKREHYFFKQDEIEYAIVSRIHRLFKQMISRWPEDLKLWISHAKFCIKWNKKVQLSKLCTRIVQVHASNPKVWILAAKWELECGDAMDKVRALFLRSFKLHLTSPEIWHEYFRAELLFAEKLQKRFKILTREDTSLNDDVGENALMKGKAAKTVYTNAIKNFPKDVNVHLKFLDILSDFIGSTDFALPLFNELKDDLGELNCNNAKMRACLAKLHLKENLGIAHEGRDKALEKKSRISNCYREFDQAVTDVNNN